MKKDIEEFLKSKNFTPIWADADEVKPKTEEIALNRAYAFQRKDLATLIAELDEIKNVIEDAKIREWSLGRMLKFHEGGLKKE